MKIHYIGYGDQFDECKDEAELEVLAEESESPVEQVEVVETYSLYKDLGIRIKKALSCNITASPTVKIVMPFDVLLFNGV